MKSRLLAAVVLTVAFTSAPLVAHAEAMNSLQSQVDQVLEDFPGGTQTGAGEISWEGGAIVLTLESTFSTFAIGSCATGSYCAWSGKSYMGAKLSFTNCSAAGTTNSVAALGVVGSIANARTSGHVTAGSYSLAANTGLTSVSGVTSMTCYTS